MQSITRVLIGSALVLAGVFITGNPVKACNGCSASQGGCPLACRAESLPLEVIRCDGQIACDNTSCQQTVYTCCFARVVFKAPFCQCSSNGEDTGNNCAQASTEAMYQGKEYLIECCVQADPGPPAQYSQCEPSSSYNTITVLFKPWVDARCQQ
jgi:hypothetical protein